MTMECARAVEIGIEGSKLGVHGPVVIIMVSAGRDFLSPDSAV